MCFKKDSGGSTAKFGREFSDAFAGEGSILDRTGLAEEGTKLQNLTTGSNVGSHFNTDQLNIGGTSEDVRGTLEHWGMAGSHHTFGTDYYADNKGSRQTGSGSGSGGDGDLDADQLDETSIASNQFLRDQKKLLKSRLYHLNPGSATTLTANMG